MLKTKNKEEVVATAEIMEVSPALAQQWLDESKFDNRRLDDRMVDRITQDIKKGKWKLDGNAIRFDKKNDLLDGQHRLYSIIRAQKSVLSIVIRGLDTEAKDTIDTGKARTIADLLHFHGHINNSVLGGCCRLLIGYKKHEEDLMSWAQNTGKLRAMPTDIIATADGDKDVVLAVQSTISYAYCRQLLGGGTLAFCYYILRKSAYGDAYVVDTFFSALEKGDNLKADDPILILRNTLSIRDMKAYAIKGSTKMQAYRVALVIKAWNAWRTNKKFQILRWSQGSEAFPTPVRTGEK